MPVPLDELHKYYYSLGSYDKKGVQRIDDVDYDYSVSRKLYDGEVLSPNDLNGMRIDLSRGRPAALFCETLFLVSTPVLEVIRGIVNPADYNEVDVSGFLSDPKADYTLVNIRRVIEVSSHNPRKKEVNVVDYTFDYSKLPPDMHLFRAEEIPGSVFISGRFAVELTAIKPNNAVFFTVHDIKKSKGKTAGTAKPKRKPKQ